MKTLGLAVLVAAAIVFQGFVVFSVRGNGTFASQTGLECTVVPAFIEFVVFVVAAMQYERIHTGAVSNPHSLIGKTLRRDAGHAPEPPKAREAWDGEWEDPRRAAEKMRVDR